MEDTKIMLSVLIPSKNEPRILETLAAIEDRFPNAQIITCNDRYGRGKGWAVREALKEAKGRFICFIDGDMDIHPRMIGRLIPFIQDYEIVVGRKQIRGILSRRILTLCSRAFLSMLFDLNIDTQTGVKLFRRESLPNWDTDGFMFDLEILAKAKIRGKSIIEVPVEANIERKMGTRSIVKCFVESLKIWSCLSHSS